MFIKKYFESLSFVQKIEVYFIVIIFYISLAIFYKEIISFVDSYFLPQNSSHIILKTKKNNQKIIRLTNNEVIHYIDEISIQKRLRIIESKIIKHSISIVAQGEYSEIITFLNTLQNHFLIQKFQISDENDFIELSISINTKFFYTNVENHISTLANPFFQDKIKEKKDTVQKIEKDFDITAILGDEVLIEDKWYDLKDQIFEYKISIINENSVVFTNILTHKKIIKKVKYE